MFKKLGQFFNKKRINKALLMAQIEALANDLFGAAVACADVLIDGSIARKLGENWEITEDERVGIVIQYLNGLLAIADRVAFAHHGPETRAEIMDELVVLAHGHLIKTFAKPDVAMSEKLDTLGDAIESYNAAVILFSGCKAMVPGDGVSRSDSVFWRFGERVSNLVGYPDDFTLIMAAGGLLFDSFGHIKAADKIRLAGH